MNFSNISQKSALNSEWLPSSMKQLNLNINYSCTDSINSSQSNKQSYSITQSYTNLTDDDKMFNKQKLQFLQNDLSKLNNFIKKQNKKYSTDIYSKNDNQQKQEMFERRLQKLQQNIKKHEKILANYEQKNNIQMNKNTQSSQIRGLEDITNKILIAGHQKIDKENENVSKQIQKIKRHIRKLVQKQQIQNQFKLLESSIKQIMASFKKCFAQQIQNLHKKQDKLKKKISQKHTCSIQQSISTLKKQFALDLDDKIYKLLSNKIVASGQKCNGTKILLKVNQQVFYAKTNQSKNTELRCSSSISPEINNFQSVITHHNQPQNFTRIQSTSTETLYYLDSEGYLMDKQSFYLLFNGQKIKLSQDQINVLKVEGIFL